MSDNTLSKDTIQRLAFIKYLLNVAIGQSRQPEPLAAASILTFHDSIELFLQLSCEHLDVSTKTNIGFMEYWGALEPKTSGSGLTQKESMKRLNKSRVALKHHGILPTKPTPPVVSLDLGTLLTAYAAAKNAVVATQAN